MVTGDSRSKDVIIITVYYIFTIAVYIRVTNISDLPKV